MLPLAKLLQRVLAAVVNFIWKELAEVCQALSLCDWSFFLLHNCELFKTRNGLRLSATIRSQVAFACSKIIHYFNIVAADSMLWMKALLQMPRPEPISAMHWSFHAKVLIVFVIFSTSTPTVGRPIASVCFSDIGSPVAAGWALVGDSVLPRIQCYPLFGSSHFCLYVAASYWKVEELGRFQLPAVFRLHFTLNFNLRPVLVRLFLLLLAKFDRTRLDAVSPTCSGLWALAVMLDALGQVSILAFHGGDAVWLVALCCLVQDYLLCLLMNGFE